MLYDIEYFHIYPNDLGVTHEEMKSIKLMSEVSGYLWNGGHKLQLSILADDYTLGTPYPMEKLISLLTTVDALPDYIVLESEMVKLKEEIYNNLNPDRITVEGKYTYLTIQNHRRITLLIDKGEVVKHTCPFLAACWYMYRLNVIDRALAGVELIPIRNGYAVPDYLINILPVSYLSLEGSIFDIISCLRDKKFDIRERIKYVFY